MNEAELDEFLKPRDYRKVKIRKETKCGECRNEELCCALEYYRHMRELCLNYEFGTSEGCREGWSCETCVLRHTRQIFLGDKAKGFHCFKCKFFKKGKKKSND